MPSPNLSFDTLDRLAEIERNLSVLHALLITLSADLFILPGHELTEVECQVVDGAAKGFSEIAGQVAKNPAGLAPLLGRAARERELADSGVNPTATSNHAATLPLRRVR